MLYEGIEILDAKDRDMLIMSNLSDVQELLQMRRLKEANDRLNAVKLMMIKTRSMLDFETTPKQTNPENIPIVQQQCTPFIHCDE